MTKGIEVELSELRKSFGDEEVLKGIDLSVKPGDFVSIIGRSGGGKSTLLRLLAGLETASSGEILFDDEKVHSIREEVRVMFQESRLLPWRTVIENVLLGLPRTDHHSHDEAEALALEMLEHVGLKGKEREWPNVLSGGQQQRVALARALVSRPKLLLLDEPLGALDAFTRFEMHELINRLWQEQQFTAFLVTHDVAEAITLSDRIILLEEGKIGLDQTVDFPRPRHKSDRHMAELEEEIVSRVMSNEST